MGVISSGRWIGLAQGIGDMLTFWILDDQSKQILARSAVRPFSKNLRVKWDPSFDDPSPKTTANNGGDIMPDNYEQELIEVIDEDAVENVIP